MRLSSDAFALGEGPTREGLSHICFHTAGRIVSCSVVMLTRSRQYTTIVRRVRPWRRAYTLGNYRIWAFMPLRRIVPLRGTLSCAFGAALLQGPTHWGLSHMVLHAAGRIVSCSVVMLTRFPTICDYRQTRSPLEKGPLARDYLRWAFMPPTAYYLPSLLAKSS